MAAPQKRKVENEGDEMQSGRRPKAVKRGKNRNQVSETNISDPEDQPAPLHGKRVVCPEGPPSTLNDPEIMKLLRMHWGEAETNQFHQDFRVISRRPLRKEDVRPPKGTWASEDPTSAELWRQYFKTRKPKDARPRKTNELAQEVHELQPEDHQVLTPGENVLLYDESDGSLARVVIWDFIEDGAKSGTRGHELVESIDKTVSELARPLRNRDDLGKIVQLGYTSGAMSAKPQDGFGWARNIISKSYTTRELREFIHRATSIQSLLWTAYQKIMPQEVIQDFINTMERDNLPRMDWNMQGKPVNSVISVNVNGKKHDFSTCELGPPSAVVAMNYAKYTHDEHNGNKYVISFTTNRTAGENEGRHFLFAKYGVKVPVRRNTVVVHRPTDLHGITLPHRSPKEDMDESLAPQQSGTSMLVADSLPRAWRNYNRWTDAQEGTAENIDDDETISEREDSDTDGTEDEE